MFGIETSPAATSYGYSQATTPSALMIYAVYLTRAHQPMLLRLLIDFLVARFVGEVPVWDREKR